MYTSMVLELHGNCQSYEGFHFMWTHVQNDHFTSNYIYESSRIYGDVLKLYDDNKTFSLDSKDLKEIFRRLNGHTGQYIDVQRTLCVAGIRLFPNNPQV